MLTPYAPDRGSSATRWTDTVGPERGLAGMVEQPDRTAKASDGARRGTDADFAQVLHNRAHESSQELHKLLVSFATGLLAADYFSLTTAQAPAAPGPQTWMAVMGLVAQGIAVLSGVFAYYCGMKRTYCQAKAYQATKQSAKDDYHARQDRWHRRERWSVWGLNTFFVVGVTSSTVYVALKLFHIGA